MFINKKQPLLNEIIFKFEIGAEFWASSNTSHKTAFVRNPRKCCWTFHLNKYDDILD